MGDVILDEMRSRNRMYLVIIVIVVLGIIATTLFFLLPDEGEKSDDKTKKADNITQNKTVNKTLPKNDSVNNSSNNANQSANNSVVIDLFDFSISEVKFLDARACGAPLSKLFEWFGDPLYPMGWLQNPDGSRGDPHSFKFFSWNETTIFTKGRLNVSSDEVVTYHYLAREKVNNSVVALVDCDKLDNN